MTGAPGGTLGALPQVFAPRWGTLAASVRQALQSRLEDGLGPSGVLRHRLDSVRPARAQL